MKLSGAAPGHLVAKHPLDIVQIDHTLADIMLVDEVFRHTIGRAANELAIRDGREMIDVSRIEQARSSVF
ncbi:hypothetical protein [Cupriavidus taiwanensis]|uniref:hypothetical protein n=1 Tax=Cupriavidus taiwanensis TaxID=164546 RepID=UPI0011C13DF8|nr:hypothetical protein [Cupriavidus taiwanensis]